MTQHRWPPTGGGGSGSIGLGDLTDVSISGVQDLDRLSYDLGTGEWVNRVGFEVDTLEPMGFVNKQNDSTLSFDDPTRTLTVTATGADFPIYVQGRRFVKTSENVVINDLEGLHLIYYDASGILRSADPGWEATAETFFRQNAFVSLVYWKPGINPSSGSKIYFAEERHGVVMPSDTHFYNHVNFGTQYGSGGALNSILADENGSLDTHVQFGCEAGVIYDEDLTITLSSRLSTANIPVYSKEGATGTWVINREDNIPVLTAGSGRAAYNQFTAGNWVQTEVANNDFFCMHVFMTNSLESGREYIVVQGQVDYPNLNQARNGAASEINALVTQGLPFAEFTPTGTIIYQTSSGYSNSVQSRIRSTGTGDDYVDFRDFKFASAGSPSDHGALGGLGDDDHLQYALLAGRAFGQTLIGGINASEDLVLQSTSNATRGWIRGLEGERLAIFDNGLSGTGVNDTKVFVKAAPTTNGTNKFGTISAIETALATGTVSQVNNGVVGVSIHNAAQDITGGIAGVQGAAQITPVANGKTVFEAIGVRGVQVHTGTAAVTDMCGVASDFILTSSAAITNGFGFCLEWDAATIAAYAGTITNFYGFYMPDLTLSGGGSIVNKYGVYVADSGADNFLAGTLQVNGLLTAAGGIDTSGANIVTSGGDINTNTGDILTGGGFINTSGGGIATGTGSITTATVTTTGGMIATGGLDTDDIDSIGTTLNIGGTTATVVNIGRAGQTVNILGATNNINATNVFVPNDLDVDGLLTADDVSISNTLDVDGLLTADGGIDRSVAAVLSIAGTNATGIDFGPDGATAADYNFRFLGNGQRSSLIVDNNTTASRTQLELNLNGSPQAVLAAPGSGDTIFGKGVGWISLGALSGVVFSGNLSANHGQLDMSGSWILGPSGYTGAHTVNGLDLSLIGTGANITSIGVSNSTAGALTRVFADSGAASNDAFFLMRAGGTLWSAGLDASTSSYQINYNSASPSAGTSCLSLTQTGNATFGTAVGADNYITVRGGAGGFFGWDDSTNATIIQCPATRKIQFGIGNTFGSGTIFGEFSSVGSFVFGTTITTSTHIAQVSDANGEILRLRNLNGSTTEAHMSFYDSGNNKRGEVGADSTGQFLKSSVSGLTLRVLDAGIYNSTTATAANVNIDTGNVLRRSTSSLRYKNIKTYEVPGMELVRKLNGFYYTSKCDCDDENQQFLGFGAEHIYEHEKTLVNYNAETKLCEGVMYDRLTVIHNKALQDLDLEIKCLRDEKEVEIDMLRKRISELEKKVA